MDPPFVMHERFLEANVEGELEFARADAVHIDCGRISETVEDLIASEQVGTDLAMLQIGEVEDLSIDACECAIRPLATNAAGINRERQGGQDIVAVEGCPIGMVEHVEGIEPKLDLHILVLRNANRFVERGVKTNKAVASSGISFQVAVCDLEVNGVAKRVNRTKPAGCPKGSNVD